jgi:hypothetical protein
MLTTQNNVFCTHISWRNYFQSPKKRRSLLWLTVLSLAISLFALPVDLTIGSRYLRD